MLVFSATGEAGEWPAIPPEVWAIRQDAGYSASGAVILDERVRHAGQGIEVWRRIRIVGESGKAAVGLPVSNRVLEVEGQTVQADGRVTPFDGPKDLITGSLKVGEAEAKLQSLIPPGLTADCVVDVHFRYYGQAVGDWTEIPILSGYPVRKKTIELSATIYGDSAMIGGQEFNPEITVGPDFRTWIYKDLPASQPEPFSDSATSLRPMLILTGSQNTQGMTTATYWGSIGGQYRQYFTTNLRAGKIYQDWSKVLRTGLVGEAAAKAAAILMRLEGQIQNGSQLTYAEFAALPKKVAEEPLEGQDLEAAVRRRRTSALGIRYLFFQLLMDEGLTPKLLLVADRNQRVFHPEFMNANQFTNVLIGVASNSGGMVWFDPARRYFPAGIVHPAYQGTRGLLIDSRDWSVGYLVMGVQGPTVNVKLYEFELSLGEEERFTLKARFSGYPEYFERDQYFSLEPQEQERKLKEIMGPALKAYTITKVGVEHATDPQKNLTWSLDGLREVEDGRHRVITPFPGLPAPLELPAAWPEARKGAIVLPYCQVYGAISRFKVPKDWAVVKEQDFQQSNEFGTVTWKTRATGNGDVMEVTFSVEVKRMLANASSYTSFRTFMAWVEAVNRRTLTLERQS
jgi:hypothetical protein